MARRTILTDRQRASLFDLPTDEAQFLKHYILSDEDLAHIRKRRRPENRLGFALQLCALRFPGRLLQPGEFIPESLLAFIGAQLGFTGDELLQYAQRRQTRYQHSSALQKIYGYYVFDGEVRKEFENWLQKAAQQARSNQGMAEMFLDKCRSMNIIIPAISTVERLCADALVFAERHICKTITSRLSGENQLNLQTLLNETEMNGRITRFVWLRQCEPGSNSSAANRLLDRLEIIRSINISTSIIAGLPGHRIAELKRQGERYYADDIRKQPKDRHFAILAVCIIEWEAMLVDAIIETHDRIVGKTYKSAEKISNLQIQSEQEAIGSTLKSFSKIGKHLILANENNERLDDVITDSIGWEHFAGLVDLAARLTQTVSADPLDYITTGHARFRRYTPRFLDLMKINGKSVVKPLLLAIDQLKCLNEVDNRNSAADLSIHFARPKWRKLLKKSKTVDRKLWETAIMFAIKDAFRSGDLWINKSLRYADISTLLLPQTEVAKCGKLAVPLDPNTWLSAKENTLNAALDNISRLAKAGLLPNGAIKNGKIHIKKLEKAIPDGVPEIKLKLSKLMPSIRITEILLQVDAEIGFTDAFTNLRTGVPCKDKVGLMNVLLADGINLGLKKMATASNTNTFWELLRIARWHIQDSAFKQALAILVDAQSKLPMAQVWGKGLTSSSDAQFFHTGGMGSKANLTNAKYSRKAGLKAYTHLSDQYGPFSTELIPSTAHEAPYILNGLVMNETGRKIKEHYTDTGGFTDHVFAMCSILGYRFAPRIRDLPHKRLYAFEPRLVNKTVRPLVAGKIRKSLISRNWPDILRLVASTVSGKIQPSLMLKKLSAYPRQNDLALALREIGRIERSIFMLDWISDTDLQRRTQIGLNKGEAHHALKRAINFNRRGEIHDRTAEGQHYRIAGMNLLAAIIIYWNTKKLGEIVTKLHNEGEKLPIELLKHTSPLGWEHIMLTGEYHWIIP